MSLIIQLDVPAPAEAAEAAFDMIAAAALELHSTPQPDTEELEAAGDQDEMGSEPEPEPEAEGDQVEDEEIPLDEVHLYHQHVFPVYWSVVGDNNNSSEQTEPTSTLVVFESIPVDTGFPVESGLSI